MPPRGARAAEQGWGGSRFGEKKQEFASTRQFCPFPPLPPSQPHPALAVGFSPFPGSLGSTGAVSPSLPGCDSPDPAQGDRHSVPGTALSHTKPIPKGTGEALGAAGVPGEEEQRLPGRAQPRCVPGAHQPSPWAGSVPAPCPSQRAKPPRARPGTAPCHCRPSSAAGTGRCCTAGGRRARPSAPLDLTAGLAELAGKKPQWLMPRSAPTRIISSYFHGKACHFLVCVFIPQPAIPPANRGAHCSLTPNPLTPQHSLQKG